MKRRTSHDVPPAFLIVMFLCIGGTGLWYGLTKLLDNYRYIQVSSSAEGVVTKLVDTRGSWAHSVAEFRYPNGQRELVVSESATRSPSVGDRVKVLFDPKGFFAPRVYSVGDFWITPCLVLLLGVSFSVIAITQFLKKLKGKH